MLVCQDERDRERDQYMFQIREQQKENKLLEQLVGLFLLPSEMGKVRHRTLPSLLIAHVAV